jgi:hypothetical protein
MGNTPCHPSFNQAWNFLKHNRSKLIPIGERHILHYAQRLAADYRLAGFNQRTMILASLFHEVGQYDPISRTAFYRAFENAASTGHICSLWDTCDEEKGFCDFARMDRDREARTPTSSTSTLGTFNSHGAKERPQCRRLITEHGLRPIIEEGRLTSWALEPGGGHVHISDGLRTQMRKMLAEGFFKETQ